jgi:2-polyprenyl-6-hydroxyphenyl methylase/3-demethylubiquinone-9 3-methyltransferase
MLAIVGAEYLMRMLPQGTHEYKKFIRPSELRRWGTQAGLEFRDIAGINYAPLNGEFSLGADVDVNYLMHFSRPA